MKKSKIVTQFSLRHSRRSSSSMSFDVDKHFNQYETQDSFDYPINYPEFKKFDFTKVSNKKQALDKLRSLSLLMRDTALEQQEEVILKNDPFSVLDMDGAQFGIRRHKKVHFLSPIRTRLEWQRGEYPVFRTEARHFNLSKENFKDRRRNTRRIHLSTIINPANNEYVIMPHPDYEWPIKGQIYITNLRLLFRVTKDQRQNIPFNMVLSCHIYKNAIEFVYLEGKSKKIDIFFVEEEYMRLLEIILHSIT